MRLSCYMVMLFAFGRCRGCGVVRRRLQRPTLLRVDVRLERHRERRLLRTHLTGLKYPLH